MSLKVVLIIFLLPLFSYSQLRTNEEIPMKLETVSTLSAFQCWVKSNSGQWQKKESVFGLGETEYKFELANIKYKNQVYYCLVRYEKAPYYDKKKNKSGIMYGIEYYTYFPKYTILENVDSSIKKYSFKLLVKGMKFRADVLIGWDEILKLMKIDINALGDTENDFLITFKSYTKEKVTQYVFGEFVGNNYSEMFVCDPQKVLELDCAYYECSTEKFKRFFTITP